MHSIDRFESHVDLGTFRLLAEPEGDSHYLENLQSGSRVELDRIGMLIFKMLPTSIAKATETLLKEHQLLLTERLVRHYFTLFRRGAIVASAQAQAEPEDLRDDIVPEARPSLSIVMITYNGEKYVRDNIDSILAQSCPADEFIIVDNHSTDRTRSMIESYGSSVQLIRNPRNYHYARAVNIGLAQATGDLIVVLNQDLVVDKYFVREIQLRYEACRDRENIAALVPQIRLNKLKGFINSIGNAIKQKGWGYDNYFGVVDVGQFSRLETVQSACFGAVVITRQGLDKVGLLDRSYVSYYEDMDWSFRARQAGMNLVVTDRAIVFHDFGGSYNPAARTRFVVKNRLRFVLKNFSGRIMLGFLKRYLKEDLRNIFYYSKSRKLNIVGLYFLAYFDLMFQFPGLLIYHIRGKAANRKTIETFFTDPKVVLANQKGEPYITTEAIRGYYYQNDKIRNK